MAGAKKVTRTSSRGMAEAKTRSQVRSASKTQGAARRKGEKAARSPTVTQMQQLQRTQAAVQRGLARLGRQGVAASGPILEGLQKAWRDIEIAVGQAVKRFRETN